MSAFAQSASLRTSAGLRADAGMQVSLSQETQSSRQANLPSASNGTCSAETASGRASPDPASLVSSN
eukprot:CAMPEP_0206546576 /NCGR_PEP_ID=MMETSP0325_2-20121206/12794_1 /ASSEMBLY_ACC=CAM_ASM_000347 /TAXON_ID=2866 /ORGANISM="Crypthecodinium cohnii, Strain Seligo" /LENGTH=66 /DNA_ID=CAMNT_0054045739 /DNA_START=372 /DNA_END=572 /DNA_ORIENTATION=+